MASNDQPQPPGSSTSQGLPAESSRTMESPRSGANKVVFSAEPESISPMMKAKTKDFDESFELDKSAKQYRTNISKKRLSGRQSFERTPSSLGKLSAAETSLSSLLKDDSRPSTANVRPESQHSHDTLVNQVTAWIKHERDRRTARKAKRKAAHKERKEGDMAAISGPSDGSTAIHDRRGSDSSEGSMALEHLASIVGKGLSLEARRRFSTSRRISSIMRRSSTAAGSDTDYFDGEPIVPSCEAVLDNSKTLAYSGGTAELSESNASIKSGKSTPKEKEAWATFKFEIVRLTHTLRFKGWRKIPLDQSNEIEVHRLSGALTNAVYVVSPPRNLPARQSDNGQPLPRNPPPKLLLRIYGPQVEHLIDRDSELQILQRLARKGIGPRMLGTFTNGRFEEFFHSKTLTAQDLRMPETSKQIAKRMRELHEGIDLLLKEREDGPFVWINWDKWVNRCENIVTWLDRQYLEHKQAPGKSRADDWKQRGPVCGVEWPMFRKTVDKYREWLEEQYGGLDKIKDRLVFAHNDTQYGNILRLIPAGESPLLLPANEHKQLVVIDFEYANANLPGLEFANHFTEWCYNYHDPLAPQACNTTGYPTPEEQTRFIRSYLRHQPTFRGSSSSTYSTPYLSPATPSLRPVSTNAIASTATAPPTLSSSISSFMLDSRAPPGSGSGMLSYQEQEEKEENATEEEIQRLMAETRLWRLANSAQWVAWGLVQARIPGMPEFDKMDEESEAGEGGMSEQARELDSAFLEVEAEAEEEKREEGKEVGEEKEEDEEFDYLGYAQDRAMFFWGDAVKLGIVKMEELPEGIRGHVKIVEY